MVKARLAKPDAIRDSSSTGSRAPSRRRSGLAKCCTRTSHDLDAVLLLDAPDDVLLERMLARGRADDTAEAISRRLACTTPRPPRCWSYYANILVTVDGVGAVEAVQDRALAA
jgi:adenylate kinase